VRDPGGLHAWLVAEEDRRHKPRMDEQGPFDRRLRRLRRERAAALGGLSWFSALIDEELIERLDLVMRPFEKALVLGCGGSTLPTQLRARGMAVSVADPAFGFAAPAEGVQCDEDRLSFADGAFDLIMARGTLDSVNDLPGALTLIRRCLRPDGHFLAAFVGAGSLPRLKQALLSAELAIKGGASPRIHPQIDVRAAGDLLLRAGFRLPVADSHRTTVRYPDMNALVADLRAAGATNILSARPRSVDRRTWAMAQVSFAAEADADGKISEILEIVNLSAWSPPAA
jgi:SAM-dependent methyltransferase